MTDSNSAANKALVVRFFETFSTGNVPAIIGAMAPDGTWWVSGKLDGMSGPYTAAGLAPLLVGWVNQCRAWLQNRRAPSVWLPYRGIRKLFHKDAVIAEHASPLFRAAPYVVFGAMCCAAAIVPSLATVAG